MGYWKIAYIRIGGIEVTGKFLTTVSTAVILALQNILSIIK